MYIVVKCSAQYLYLHCYRFTNYIGGSASKAAVLLRYIDDQLSGSGIVSNPEVRCIHWKTNKLC